KTILRTYQGTFHHFTPIRERQLARLLKMEVSDIYQVLQKLKQDAVIDFQPQKDKPQIIFLEERLSNQDLLIDKKQYDFRKNRHLEKMKKAIAYVEDAVCRSRQLLQYFGEESKPCGSCDVCLGRTKTELSDEGFERYKQKIATLLHQRTLTLDQLVAAFAPRRQQEVLTAINYLVDEGFIETEGEQLIWKK
ncbi:MAG: RecQ family zinc-binding domain-containing protein, partial [Bacteroidota bacterium]